MLSPEVLEHSYIGPCGTPGLGLRIGLFGGVGVWGLSQEFVV